MMALNKRQRTSFVLSFTIPLLLSFVICGLVHAQEDTTRVNRKKLNTLIIASAVGYTGAVATLNYVWYKDTDRQSFQFFNDNAEWKQVDKAGHFFNSFYLSDISS